MTKTRNTLSEQQQKSGSGICELTETAQGRTTMQNRRCLLIAAYKLFPMKLVALDMNLQGLSLKTQTYITNNRGNFNIYYLHNVLKHANHVRRNVRHSFVAIRAPRTYVYCGKETVE